MTATTLGTVGMLVELFIGRDVPGMHQAPALVSIATCASLLIVLLVTRRHVTVRFASVVFLANAMSIACGLALREPDYLAAGDFMFSEGNKLGCLIAAMIAPQLWSALVAIGIHFSGIVFVLVVITAEQRGHLMFEPGVSIIFAVIGCTLALYRQRRLRLEAEIATMRTERLAAERQARTVMAIRDLSNTPIQVIELCCEILKRSEVEDQALLDRLCRAVAHLREISELLRVYDAAMTWRMQDVSLDAAAEIESSARAALAAHGAAAS